MADKDFTTTRPNPLIEEPEQIKFALLDISELAASIKALSDEIVEGDRTGYLNASIGHLATKIGWIADRSVAVLKVHTLMNGL